MEITHRVIDGGTMKPIKKSVFRRKCEEKKMKENAFSRPERQNKVCERLVNGKVVHLESRKLKKTKCVSLS